MQDPCLLEEALCNSNFYKFYCGNNCMNIQGPTCLPTCMNIQGPTCLAYTCNNVLESVTLLSSCNDYINYVIIGIIFKNFRYLEKNQHSKLCKLKLMFVLQTSIAAQANASWLSH